MTPVIFLRCGPQREKIINIVGNNAEKHKWTEIWVVFCFVPYNVEKWSVAGNNAEELLQRWTVEHFFVNLSLLLKGQVI